MKQSEFVKWLSQRGATFQDGAKHLQIFLNDRQSLLPPHPSKELKRGLVEEVNKRLGLK